MIRIVAGLALLLPLLAHAGFDEGVEAYAQADYAKAMAEFKPLAEQEALSQSDLDKAKGELDAKGFLLAPIQERHHAVERPVVPGGGSTGTASVATYQTALRSVKYDNSSSNPSTATRTGR